jgi:hypothetical protein
LPRRLALAQANDAAAPDVDGGKEVHGKKASSYRLSALARYLQLEDVESRRATSDSR